MSSIVNLMSHDHRACDDEFVQIEAAFAKGDWRAAIDNFAVFSVSIERHFLAEELQLFPAFEKATGMSSGPTAVMRMEHGQIRDLLSDLCESIETQDLSGCQGSAETLLIMMQQHNMKEENILYPMCDQHLQALPLCSTLSSAIKRA